MTSQCIAGCDSGAVVTGQLLLCSGHVPWFYKHIPLLSLTSAPYYSIVTLVKSPHQPEPHFSYSELLMFKDVSNDVESMGIKRERDWLLRNTINEPQDCETQTGFNRMK